MFKGLRRLGELGLVEAASINDLKPGEKMGLELEGKLVLLVNLGGTFYAIGGKCTHRGCMLKDGTIKGERIQCVCHGSTFELKTGAVFRGPAKEPEPSYRVKIEGDKILINV